MKTLNDLITLIAAEIEAAYMIGFEPSSDSLSAKEIYEEALAYLTDLSIH